MDVKMEENLEETVEEDFQLYGIQEAYGERHCVLRIPRKLPPYYCSEDTAATLDIFNILMADVSGSMLAYWPHVVTGWQRNIMNKLTGKTKIYVFASRVDFIREGTNLTEADNLGGGTNLTAALKTVREEVHNCSESNVRVFIVTDGQHGYGDPLPETEITKMMAPPGKTVTVYLLGIGTYFPVNYSIDIRSQLHNGNANIPSLFWAKSILDIVDQMAIIGDELYSSLVTLELNIEGSILPGLDKTTSCHLGEWIYFDQPAEDLPSMSVKVNGAEPRDISVTEKPATMRHFLDYVFRQWNSVLIQQHRKKAHVPRETFDLMDDIFRYFMSSLKIDIPQGNDIKSRMTKKRIKSYNLEYRTLKNQSKTIIDVEGTFENELELADAILKTTVTNRKYDLKNLKLKGHGLDDYERDLESFQKLFEKAKPEILKLPSPTPEDCCRVTIASTLSDLQDPNFHLMFEESKFELLRTFTMSGIPIYAPVRDASQINPWTLVIKHILVTPFTILSQQVLEQSAESGVTDLGEDKDVILQKDNEKTRFNAIIPIVPASAAKVLKTIVLSNIYAMMATFCILKNPHIIDYSAHLAALGCAWIRTVREFPVKSRPEFARDRLECIAATAKLYMDRPSVSHYVNALISDPKQALMTESVDEFNGKNLKCESLIKPAFFMFLNKDKFSKEQVCSLLKLMLYEFIGRCLSNYKVDETEASPFTDFFCMELADPGKRKVWFDKHFKTILNVYQTTQGNLLERFYTLDDLLPSLKKYVSGQVLGLVDKPLENLEITTNMKKVKKLSNFGACGDIRWSSFQSWAEEMGLPDEAIQEAFKPAQVMVYVTMALNIKNSKDRLKRDLQSTDSVLETVTKKVVQENARSLRISVLKEVEEYAVVQWREAYLRAHKPLVMPMTVEEVIEAAKSRNIEVTRDTFHKVYRYTERLGLLRNACQIPDCPHYLQPHNNFNQHLSIEREEGDFPHALHLVSHEFCGQGIDGVIKEVVSGKHTGTKNRKPPPQPAPTALQPLLTQLESLLQLYNTNNSMMSEVRLTEQNKADTEDDEFYDCNT